MAKKAAGPSSSDIPDPGDPPPRKPAEKPAPARPAPAKPAPEKPTAARPPAEKPAPAKPAAARPSTEKPAAARPAGTGSTENSPPLRNTAKPPASAQPAPARKPAPKPDPSQVQAEAPAPQKGAVTRKPAVKPDPKSIQAEPPVEETEAVEQVEETAEKKPADKKKGADKKAKPPAPKKTTGVWGIDLGQCGLKAVRLEERDGQIVATAFDFVEHPKILSQPDADPDQLTREALEKFLTHNSIKGDIVCIAVPGQSGLARFVKLPPVEEKKIGDIVRFEAKQQIPFNLDEVVWDYQKLGAGMVTDGFALDTEIGLFAMKRDAINKYLQHFKDVSVDVHVVQMAPLALCNYVAYDLLGKGADAQEESGPRQVVVALDIGTDASNLVITDGGRIIWQRPIPLGGNHFTRALTKDLKLTFAKAEHLKRNAMKSPELKQILASIKPVLNDFVSEVQRSLGYFTNTHRDVQIQYMVGLGNAFRLPGMQRFLQEKLQLEVRKMDTFQRLTGPGVLDAPLFTENILSFGVAYGLAVQGLQKARLLTNLLPPEIRVERLIKAKKPWAAAAAAVLLLSIAALAFGYGRQYSAYVGKPIEDARRKAKTVIDNVTRAESNYQAARSSAEDEKLAVTSIAAGQKEQVNWLELSTFIDEVVPRPEDAFRDGALPESAKPYLAAARDAFTKEYLPWLRGTGSTLSEKDHLADGLDRIIQFNIEAVHCRYSDKLSTYWGLLKDDIKKVDRPYVQPIEDRKSPPGETDKGWVIELRGYTYHEKQNVAVIELLMANIVRKAIEKGWRPKPPEPQTNPGGGPAPVGGPGPGLGGPMLGGGPGDQQGPKRIISHVLLHSFSSKPADGATGFDILATSKLPELVKNVQLKGGGSGGPGGPAGPGGSGGPGVPGGPGGGQFGGAPSGPPGVGPMGGAPSGPPGAGAMGGGFPAGPPGAGGGGASIAADDNWKYLGNPVIVPPGQKPADDGTGQAVRPRYQRTEFVVMFIWQEPTPSDEEAKSGSGGGPGGGPVAPVGGGRR